MQSRKTFTIRFRDNFDTLPPFVFLAFILHLDAVPFSHPSSIVLTSTSYNSVLPVLQYWDTVQSLVNINKIICHMYKRRQPVKCLQEIKIKCVKISVLLHEYSFLRNFHLISTQYKKYSAKIGIRHFLISNETN